MSDTTDKLKEAQAQVKDLKQKAKDEVVANKVDRAKARESRDTRIVVELVMLKDISTTIYAYRKMGKKARVASNVLMTIRAYCNSAVEGVTVETEEVVQND